MKEFLLDCLNLPFKTNSQDNPEHENQVEELLKKHNLEYISQPNGTQNSPDFYVFHDGERHSIECKSSKNTYPMYNSGLPKEEYIYIFSTAKYNETTLFKGSSVVPKQKRELYEGLLKDLGDVLQRYQNTPEWQEDNRGFDFYVRKMYTQCGGATKTDYFRHDERKQCEEEVLNLF